MTRYLFALLCLLGIAVQLNADNVVSLTTVSGQPGDEVEMALSLQNTDNIAAVEVKIPLDRYVQYVNGSAVLNESRSDGHQLSASGDNNELRLYVYNIYNNAIKGNNGTLVTFRLRLGRNPEHLALNPVVVMGAANGESIESRAESATVTILAPQLTITSTTIDYGHVPIRSTYTRSLTLKNTGTSTLHVSDIVFSAAELSATDRNFAIEAGESHSVTVSFAPVNYGEISETATVMSDAVNEEQTATIISDPYSVNELRVGTAEGNSDTEVSVGVSLKNMEPIVAAQWTFTLPNALKYVDGSVAVASHAEGLAASATVSSNKLTVFVYSQNNTPIPEGNGEIVIFRLLLQGQSGTYSLTPSNITLGNITLKNMVSASYNGSVRIKSPRIAANSTLVMPEMPVTETVSQTFAIRNSGQVDMSLTRVTFLNEGFSVVEELPLTISPNATKNITVQYVPTVAGEYSTTMQIYTNDPETRMKSVAVSGTTFEPNTVSLTGEWTEANTAYVVGVTIDNYTELVALQMDLHLPEGADIIDVASALETSSRLDDMSASITKIDDSIYRIVVYSLSNGQIQGHDGKVFSVKIGVEDAYTMGKKNITIDNILLSDTSGKNYASVAEVVNEIPDCFVPGDVNGDGRINAQDLTLFINKTLDKEPANFVEAAADLNRDGVITAQDLTLFINLTLK